MEMHIDLLILLVVQLMVIKIQRTFNICHENKYIYRFKKKKKPWECKNANSHTTLEILSTVAK